MKADEPSCSWVKVAEALGNKHNKDACKHRYKELQNAGTERDSKEAKSDSKEAKSDDEAKKNKGKDNKHGKKNDPDEVPADRPMSKKERKQAARDAAEAERKEKQNGKPADVEAVASAVAGAKVSFLIRRLFCLTDSAYRRNDTVTCFR